MHILMQHSAVMLQIYWQCHRLQRRLPWNVVQTNRRIQSIVVHIIISHHPFPLTLSGAEIGWLIHINPNAREIGLLKQMLIHFLPISGDVRVPEIRKVGITRPNIPHEPLPSGGRSQKYIIPQALRVALINRSILYPHGHINKHNIITIQIVLDITEILC